MRGLFAFGIAVVILGPTIGWTQIDAVLRCRPPGWNGGHARIERPGTVLTDVASLETGGGNRVFNRFDIPQLHGINRTAPYFHDHRANTLEEVVVHYQKFFFLINQVRGFPLPLIADEDIAPIVACMKKGILNPNWINKSGGVGGRTLDARLVTLRAE